MNFFTPTINRINISSVSRFNRQIHQDGAEQVFLVLRAARLVQNISRAFESMLVWVVTFVAGCGWPSKEIPVGMSRTSRFWQARLPYENQFYFW
jgi:hypothetical protein